MEILHIKYATDEMKNTLDGLNSRMEMTEERNSEPDRSIEIIHIEPEEVRREWKREKGGSEVTTVEYLL